MSLLDDALVVVDGGLEALAATTEALSEMIESALDALGPRAWRYPPALAGRVYAQLLRASFDPVDEGAVSDDLDAFRDALLHPEGAARAMGIRPAAHAALHAWCLARHHRAWIVGEGPLAASPTTARSAGARAFAFAADAEADADEPEEAYALLTAATRALARGGGRRTGRTRNEKDQTRRTRRDPRRRRRRRGFEPGSRGGVRFGARRDRSRGVVGGGGALGDFFQDTSPPAGSLARASLARRARPTPRPRDDPRRVRGDARVGRRRGARARAPPPRRSRPISRAIRATPVAPRDARSPSEYADTPSAKPTRVYAPPPTRRLTPTRTRNSTPTRTRKPTPTPRTRPGCERWRRDARRWRTRSRRICRRACRPPSVGRRRPPRRGHRGVFHRGSVRVVGRDASVGRLRARRVSRGEDFQSAVAAAVADRDDEENARVFIDGPEVARGNETRRFEPLCLEFRVAPLVFGWVAGRADVLRRATRRSVERETWRPVMDGWTGDPTDGSSSSDVGAALSAVELVRSAWDTLEAFWNLNLPAPVAALRALTEAVDGAFPGVRRDRRRRGAAGGVRAAPSETHEVQEGRGGGDARGARGGKTPRRVGMAG